MIITKMPISTKNSTEIVEQYSSSGDRSSSSPKSRKFEQDKEKEQSSSNLFEEEFLDILNKFVDRKLRFYPMFAVMHYLEFDDTYVINIYEDIEQNALFKSFKLEHVDFVYTGMTVESMNNVYELVKLINYNLNKQEREIYVAGFLQYQLDKWNSAVNISKKVVHFDKAFQQIFKKVVVKDQRPKFEQHKQLFKEFDSPSDQRLGIIVFQFYLNQL